MLNEGNPYCTPQLWSVEETGRALGLGRTSVYKLLNAGQLTSICIGGRRLIVRTSVSELIARHLTAGRD